MHRLSLLGGSRQASTYGPDRLVSQYRICQSSNTMGIQHCLQLPEQDRQGIASLPLRQSLPQAKQRNQAGSPGRPELPGHQSIGFSVHAAPLRMPNDHIMAGKIQQHGGSNFAGVSPGFMRTHILSPQGQTGARQQTGNLIQVGMGNTNRKRRC